MIGNLITKTPNNWNPWHSIRTLKGGKLVPSAAFPPRYLPAKGFWAQSFGTHCQFVPPWVTFTDPFTAFLLAGGASASIIGSIAGVAVATSILSEKSTGDWGIGQEYLPPTVGYCMGNNYKEMGYIRISMVRAAANVLGYKTYADVVQMSRFKHMYIYQGTVQSYDSATKILTLDIDGDLPEDASIEGSLKIYSQSGETLTVSIAEVKDNYQIELSIDEDDEDIDIVSGDFYKFNQIITKEDPYLLTGYYWGTEENWIEEGDDYKSNSENDLHVTSDNKFYEDLTFTGSYVLKNTISDEVQIIRPGSSMLDSGNFEWVWIKSGQFEDSEVYANDPDRYKETTEIVEVEIPEGEANAIETEEPTEEGSGDPVETYKLEKRKVGTAADLQNWTEEGAIYFRLELSKGGTAFRNNWHAPALTKCWFKQGENYFKIWGQPDGNIIDVARTDITGKQELDLNGEGSITNPYGWFISEHFMGAAQTGIFGGTATASGTIVTVKTPGESEGTMNQNTVVFKELRDGVINSFYNRFRLDDASNGGTVGIWKKFDGWRVTNSQGKSIKIESIEFEKYPREPYTEYTITCQVEKDASSFNGQEVWVTFDKPYKRLTSQKAPLYTGLFVEGLDQQGNINICSDMSWTSAPMEVDLPDNLVVGVCAGHMFGVADSYFIRSNNGLPLLVSTLSADGIGISCLYNRIKQEDWVVYKDVYTKKLTARTGLLDFTDRPQKIEISLGLPEASEETSFPVTLNKKYDRTKIINMNVSASDSVEAIQFKIGADDEDSYHGFLIGGNGEVDFQTLRYAGVGSGETEVDRWKYKEYNCSPVFIYTQCETSLVKGQTLFIGASTEDGPIYAYNGKPAGAVIEYVSNKQTLDSGGGVNIHRIGDGENILVYGNIVPPFSIDGKIYNSDAEGNQWFNSKGVFVAGTANEGLLWGCPIVKNVNYNNDGKYQWAVMPLCNVNYQTSVVSGDTELCIISEHFVGSKKYLGAYTVSLLSLPYQTELCTPIDDTEAGEAGEAGEGDDDHMNFLWRPTVLDENAPEWADEGNYPSVEQSEDSPSEDYFTRIMGREEFECDVESDLEDWGFVNGFVWIDGTYILFYDDSIGVRMLFSTNQGRVWQLSEIIICRDGYSGLIFSDNTIVCITPLGIVVKLIDSSFIHNAFAAVEGTDETFIEDIQRQFDDTLGVLLSTGQINPQRLAGYEDDTGKQKIFYYDSEGLLSSFESVNFINWSASPNF